jgi:hypothetical protein
MIANASSEVNLVFWVVAHIGTRAINAAAEEINS